MLNELESYLDLLETKYTELKDVLIEIGDNAATLNWRPSGEDSFSIFALVADVALQEEFWVSHVVNGQAEPVGLDMVQEAQGSQIEPLLQLLDAAHAHTAEVLAQMDAEQLNRKIEFNGDLLTTRWCLLNTVQHVAENLGQITVIWQWWQQNQDSIN